ncbi:L-histidine N(alpha)-methyltransferase [Sphingobacteriaceae bacterium]|nr:L-histidine N(alpha)-methyltransferase [Sphingobacteriaceae bacterium]
MILNKNRTTLNREHSPVNSSDKFREEILDGLTNSPKHLHSKYFYDKEGDKLFQQIMELPEYYLTRCELDIFKNKTEELIAAITKQGDSFDLIELGAGDATKSSYLLQELVKRHAKFSYMPIDISGNILRVLDEKLCKEVPDLDVVCLEGEYFDMLSKASTLSSRRKVVLFLGGNLGNMPIKDAYLFCSELRQRLHPGDLVLIGFDLKKYPQTILNAYSDKSGVTAKFNLNLLTRINRELDANFDLKQFQHYQTYDPKTGACKSYLISLSKQEVQIDNATICFEKNEAIFMEISQKFSLSNTRDMAEKSGFEPVSEVMDSKKWFVDSIWLAI